MYRNYAVTMHRSTINFPLVISYPTTVKHKCHWILICRCLMPLLTLPTLTKHDFIRERVELVELTHNGRRGEERRRARATALEKGGERGITLDHRHFTAAKTKQS